MQCRLEKAPCSAANVLNLQYSLWDKLNLVACIKLYMHVCALVLRLNEIY